MQKLQRLVVMAVLLAFLAPTAIHAQPSILPTQVETAGWQIYRVVVAALELILEEDTEERASAVMRMNGAPDPAGLATETPEDGIDPDLPQESMNGAPDPAG